MVFGQSMYQFAIILVLHLLVHSSFSIDHSEHGDQRLRIKELIEGWSFTEIGGGEGTKDGEWLSIERVPTTVHAELLKAKRIPDPVS